MDVVTWNVNSLRARMPLLIEFLEERRPEIVCLQETKVRDELFPREPLEDLGYQVEAFGQRTYNGVAILSRIGMEDAVRGFPDDSPDAERRLLGVTVGDLMVVSVYVVNGREVGSAKYAHKLEWMERLHDFVHERYDPREKVLLAGDFNCTVDDRDVYDPEQWRDRILCSEPERDALAQLMSLGFKDLFRCFHEEGGHYTWWDFRTRGFERGRGLRIDHFLASPAALEVCTGVEIDVATRGGQKPSDHAPVIASFA